MELNRIISSPQKIYLDSESDTSFHSARDSESESDNVNTSSEEATSDNDDKTESLSMDLAWDEDWESLDDYMCEDELFSTCMFYCAW